MVATYEQIIESLRKKDYKPVYLLTGEEPFFIDQISDYIEKNVLTDDEKGFNQTVLYGLDVDVSTIVNTAKRYPLMSKYQVVIVKEAQNVKKLDELVYYFEKPLNSTILVICYKNGTLGKYRKMISLCERIGYLLVSNKMRDNKLPDFVTKAVKSKGLNIEVKATQLLVDSVGSDLNRLMSELNKLVLSVPADKKGITFEQVEENIGLSKEFNVFEFKNAIINKDVFKANQIINYFESNPKANPIQPTLALLFGFFSNLMVAYYAPQKTKQGITAYLGFSNEWQSLDYIKAMQNYSGVKVMTIISKLREADALSKGFGGASSLTNADILRELIYYIIH
jgi:DNA polymerase III subunit delta